MKSTDHFKQTIQAYLEERAKTEALFALSYAKEGKSIDDCVTYILNTVQKSGCCGFTDDEVYSMAVHYYDEDNIEIGKSIDCRVVVNHTVELTEEEKQEARLQAMERVKREAYERIIRKNTAKSTNAKPNTAAPQQMQLMF